VSITPGSGNRVLFKEGDKDRAPTGCCRAGRAARGRPHRGDDRAGTARGAQSARPKLPRKITARAVDPIEYLSIDSELLDMMITWDQTGTYEVGELQAQFAGGGGDDWMTTLLQTKAFHRIPPANIQAIFMRMQRINCRAGETIIQQGAEGDFFYAIVSGKCLVTRETPLNRGGMKLAELTVGDTFGEEALISEAKRNATVTMLTDGVLMRLNKQDFRDLMNEPLLQWVDYARPAMIIGAAAIGSTCACPPSTRTSRSRARSTFRCTSSA
jgi:hypothetical protein